MKILVIQTAFPGDAVLTLPLIQKIREKEPAASIDILCIPSTHLIFENSPAVDKTLVYDKKNSDKNFRKFFQILKLVRGNNYQSVYSPHRSARSSIISYYSGASERISFNNSVLSFLYTKIITYRQDWHEVQRNLSLIGETNWKVLPVLKLEKEIERKIDVELSRISESRTIAVAPGSVWATKRYPLEYYKEIVDSLIQNEFSITVLGGSSDAWLGKEIESVNADQVINFCGKLSFLESIAVLKKSELLISNDSAPAHLGLVADIPVLTIYCSTIKDFGFYPYNEGSKTISYDQLDCKPCGIHGHQKCPEGHFDCGFKLKPGKVLETVGQILQDRHSKKN